MSLSETHTCTDCNQALNKGGFYKKQWKLKDEGRCKTCFDAYQKTQQRQGQKYTCVECKEEKGKKLFYKSQRCEGGRCKPCHDRYENTGRPTNLDHKQDAANNKRKLLPAKTANLDANKKLKPQLERSENGTKEHWQNEVNEGHQQAKHSYYTNFGVGYEPPMEWLLRYKNEPLVNESLVGTYKLVFYSSDDYNEEQIHRTARGIMRLTIKEFKGLPALWGRYIVDTRKMRNITPGKFDALGDSNEESWGTYPRGSFIEVGTDWTPPKDWNGFNNFKCHDTAEEVSDEEEMEDEFSLKQGRKHFILNREELSCGYDADECRLLSDMHIDWRWWEDKDLMDRVNAYCGAVLKVVAKRHALGLFHDVLPGEIFHPYRLNHASTATQHDIVEEPNNLELAERLMTTYRDGSNSWMHRHLSFPGEVAFKIREFVTPPPVFYVEEGDLMFVVEESQRPEWTKHLIFRRIDD